MQGIKQAGLLFTVLFVMESAYAEIPVILSGPTPPIPSTLSVGTSNAFVYTIINNVPNHSFPLIISGISSPIIRTPVANDCGNVIPRGPSTCNFGIVITPGQADAGNLVNQTLLVDYGGRRPLHSNIVFFAAGPTPPPPDLAVLTAVGTNTTGGAFPLLAVSTNAGSSWAVKAIIGLPASGSFFDSSCTGTGASTICTAVGQDFIGNTPLLAVSIDGGNTWIVKAVIGSPASGQFGGTSCTGTGSTAICTAVGQDLTGNSPLLAVSTNGGNTWAVEAVFGLPATGFFSSTSCTGSGVTAVCTAVGQDLGTGSPLLAVSTDGSNTWAVKAVGGAPASGIFNSTSCTGSGVTAVCTAVGQDLGTGSPLLAVSTDGANTWSVKAIAGSPATGVFLGASCTDGLTAICTAVGQDLTGSAPPLVAVSNDGANTWSVKAVAGAPASAFFNATSCTGSGATAVCTAVGGNLGLPPLLAVSTDGGNTWAVKAVIGLPALGLFQATSCTTNGGIAICIAAGQDNTGSQPPLLVMSIDGGNTWAVQTVIGLPTTGVFFGTGASSSLSNVLEKKYGIKNELEGLLNVY